MPGSRKPSAAPSRLPSRVYVSRTPKVDVLHLPPGTKFFGDPAKGSGKVHVPKNPAKK
jgi:hypothetical protein